MVSTRPTYPLHTTLKPLLQLTWILSYINQSFIENKISIT